MTPFVVIRLSSRIFFDLPLLKRCVNYSSSGSFHLKNIMHKNGLPFYPISSSHLKNSYRLYSSDSKKDSNPNYVQEAESTKDSNTAKVNQRTRLKQAIRDYGATIVVFHVAISLASLGICYVAISNGVDAVRVLSFLGFSESLISSKVAVGGSTFVMAYAVHKLFAPVRIGITLSVAPFIVRYLRRINWLKPPKSKT
ncbi:protein FAM210B, mitochondrial [Trichonephila clavata]|uniref:Protein FAM210B, mitochondrial n=1 Tax=Trichonephila clavata TaxID=2740835 RepID=A0A8X6EZC8_TRICU|nr:protein FAM210B, mitochondrial [Trichonephila clavata]